MRKLQMCLHHSLKPINILYRKSRGILCIMNGQLILIRWQLRSIVAEQANPIERTMQQVNKFFDYASTHPYVILTYHKSDMFLVYHSDASHLSETKDRSRTGGNSLVLNNI